jgi:hypothetical protein
MSKRRSSNSDSSRAAPVGPEGYSEIDEFLIVQRITLDAAPFGAFLQTVENPPAPGPKLRALMSRVPAWQK